MLHTHPLPVLRSERDFGGVRQLQHELLLRQRLQKLVDLLVVRLRQRADDLGIEGVQPAREIPHLERSAAILHEHPVAGARGIQVLRGRFRVGGRVAHRLDLSPDDEAVSVHRVGVARHPFL